MNTSQHVLSEVIQIISGGTPKTDHEEYWNGKIGWLSVVDFGNVTKFVEKSEKTITEDGLNNSSTKILEIGDIIISARGTVGAMAILKNRMAFNQSCFGLRAKPELLNQDFLYYYLKNYMKELKIKSQGSVFETINLATFDMIKVNLPDLPTQKKIADVLSCIDDKIALNNKTNSELENMAKTVYDYWFTQFDFPDANGNPYKTSGGKMEYNQVLKREIPAGWEVKQLRTFLDCNKNSISKTNNYSYINYLDTGSLTENVISEYQIITDTDALPSRAKRIVQKNDILYSSVRPILKHYGIIKSPKENMIASTGFIILSSKKNPKYNDFFYNYIISESNLNKLVSIAASNVSAYPSINPDDLLDLYIPVPTGYELLDDFIANIEPIYETISLNQKENEELTKLRDYLLPLLMNGQIEVK